MVSQIYINNNIAKYLVIMRVSLIVLEVLLCCVSEVFSVPKRIQCPTIKLQHGRVRYRTKNRFVKFTCEGGFILAGERYSTCVNGNWDAPIPKCVRASCKKVTPPANVIIYPSHRGGVLNFFCKPGYDLRGDNVTYCDGNKWDNKLPTCMETSKSPSLTCNFETEDLCSWTHDILHDFDWKRKNFRTPSGHLGTGPSYDHTKGVGSDGYYMFVESSSRNENDTARLISPIFDKMDDGDVCLNFFYHMYGSTTGQLRVYLKKVSDSWELDPDEAIFWKSGNHGDVWLSSWHNLGTIDQDFQIVIEGVRGKSYYSDIAIDDVEIIPNCTDVDFTTENDVSYSFDETAVPSCLNRCDISTNRSQYSCDCEESCIDNNTCCIDYTIVCVLGAGTEEYDGTIDSTMSTSTATTLKFVKTTSKKSATTKFTTASTVTTKRLLKTTQKTTSPTKKIVKIKTFTIPPPSQGTRLLNDLVTISHTMSEPDMNEIITFKDEITITPVKMRNSERNQETNADTKTIIITACIVTITIAVVIIIIGIRRYSRLISCGNLKMKSSNGDSQSDVRFLTSDEILNFNLAYVDD